MQRWSRFERVSIFLATFLAVCVFAQMVNVITDKALGRIDLHKWWLLAPFPSQMSTQSMPICSRHFPFINSGHVLENRFCIRNVAEGWQTNRPLWAMGWMTVCKLHVFFTKKMWNWWDGILLQIEIVPDLWCLDGGWGRDRTTRVSSAHSCCDEFWLH